ncbi:MAG: ABC transporter substrate-binding protein [bacterium]|nr:ABC transporter substrate-binding protein [bacterium]
MQIDSQYDSRPISNGAGTKEHITTTLTKERGVRRFATLENLLRSFRPGERLALYVLSIGLSISVFILLAGLNAAVSTTVPARGGSLVEGEVGTARFINPILAISQPDQDLTALVYSGLMRALPHGEIVPDLASSYEISEDGTIYTFILRDDAIFHDTTPVTSADVLSTVQAAQNPDIKSPRRADWEGVVASAPDAHTIVFQLPHPYAPFIFNTTLGIMPKHLWQNVSAQDFPFNQLNTHPVGSGPYRVSSVNTDSTGAATRYDLSSFKKFVIGSPYLKNISYVFFPNENDMIDAFNERKISALSGISPSSLPSLKRTDTRTLTSPLPRVFGVFFNQNRAPALADSSVRQALNIAIDKKALVQDVLAGYGVPLSGPIPPGVLSIASDTKTDGDVSHLSASSTSILSAQENARKILSRGGWTFVPAATSTAQIDGHAGVWKNKKKQTLTFTLATADEPELVATAKAIAESWGAIGVAVNVQVYPLSELNTAIIRPRAYDAILFGEVVGREGDLFAFWHSSQRNDPGLNLAMYANAKADSLLATARATTDQKQREKLYEQFASVVDKDGAAVFLYSPDFLYVVPTAIQGIELGALTTPAERYLNVYQWYTDTERVWEIFIK